MLSVNVNNDSHSDQPGINQSCTLFGATSGSDIIFGRNYILAGYGLHVSDMWRRNFVILIAFFIVFLVLQMLALEYYPVSRVY